MGLVLLCTHISDGNGWTEGWLEDCSGWDRLGNLQAGWKRCEKMEALGKKRCSNFFLCVASSLCQLPSTEGEGRCAGEGTGRSDGEKEGCFSQKGYFCDMGLGNGQSQQDSGCSLWGKVARIVSSCLNMPGCMKERKETSSVPLAGSAFPFHAAEL